MLGILFYLMCLSISSSRASFSFPSLSCSSNFNLSHESPKSTISLCRVYGGPILLYLVKLVILS